MQDVTNGKFLATARSHGQVGFHALVGVIEPYFLTPWISYISAYIMIGREDKLESYQYEKEHAKKKEMARRIVKTYWINRMR